jgi:4-amino-4-deoxy-L-arabinose transferase-like glycosyltransferase
VTGKRVRSYKQILTLAIIFVGVSLSTVVWTEADKTPPPWDPADHISAGYDYYQSLAQLRFGDFARDFFYMPHFYAPLVHIVTALVFIIFGASELPGIGVNFISLALMLGAIYWTAKRLYANDPAAAQEERVSVFWPGGLAALLAVCYHFPAWLVHDAFLDFPLMAITAASFALLIRAGDFKNRRHAIAFGVAAGLGMLVKQTFPFFFILPALYVTVRVLAGRDRRAVVNLALAAVLAAVIAGIWYVPHMDDVLSIYRVNKVGAINENEAPLYTIGSNLFYVHALLSTQVQVPFGALFLFGLIYSIVRHRKQSVLLYLWILSGVVAFSFVANKDARYTVPILPAVALVSISWMAGPKVGKEQEPRELEDRADRQADAKTPSRVTRALKPALAAAIVVWAVVSFINSQWPRDGYGLSYDLPLFSWRIFARNYYGFDHRPLPDDWSLTEIIQTVKAHRDQERAQMQPDPKASTSSASSRQPTPEETVSPPTKGIGIFDDAGQPILGIVVNMPQMNPSNIGLYARLLAPERAGPPLIYVDWLVVESALDRLATCDYLLVRSGYGADDYVAPVERQIEEILRANPERYTKIASFAIPNNQEAIIYKIEKGARVE